jgi:hypothetical protein
MQRSADEPSLGAARPPLPEREDCLLRRSGAKAGGEGNKLRMVFRTRLESPVAFLESKLKGFLANGVSNRSPVFRSNDFVAQTEPAL